MLQDFKIEDIIILALVILGLTGGIILSFTGYAPVVAAILLALVVSSAFFRFLGGVEGASLVTGSIKLGGTAAVFLIITWFVNDRLEQQARIEPNPETWVALNHQLGVPVAVEVNGRERVSLPRPNPLRDYQWHAKFSEQGLVLTSQQNDSFAVGYINFNALESLQLFNAIEDPSTLRFTDKLSAGQQNIELAPYRIILNVGQFDDGLSAFTLIDATTNQQKSGSLRNKASQIITLSGRHYLILVAAAVHNEEEKWVQFGFVELTTSLDRAKFIE